MRSPLETQKCSLKNTVLYMLATSVLTLLLLALIVNLAPVKIANIFLNPIGVAKGLQYMQEAESQKEMEISKENFKKALASKREKIFDKSAPFLGNRDAKVEIVIFSDYKCGYCRGIDEVASKILADPKYKGKVKFIIKEYPILSQASTLMAIAALEAFQKDPSNFMKVNHALYGAGKASSREEIIQVVRNAGTRIDLRNTEKSEEIISANLSLGAEIGVRGTPAIIIGEEFIGGFIGENEMRSKIEALL
jgi:protein-disulfide isomerase